MSDPILRAENLTEEFGKLITIDDMTLDVERGEFRSLISPSGAGKTTMFSLLTSVFRSARGTVTLNGENVATLPPHERVHRGLGRSFQTVNVFSGFTVHESVRLTAQAAREGGFTSVEAYLRRSDVFDDVNEHTDHVPNHSDLLGRSDKPVDVLAYDDKRRPETAVMLVTDLSMVLLNEPTAGISTEETRAMMDLIDEVLLDQALLLIERDIDLVMRVSDHITVLHHGEVPVEGTSAAASESPKVRGAHLEGAEM